MKLVTRFFLATILGLIMPFYATWAMSDPTIPLAPLGQGKESQGLQLQGILIRGQLKSATINNHIYRVGEKHDGIHVLAIGHYKVLVKHWGAKKVLRLAERVK